MNPPENSDPSMHAKQLQKLEKQRLRTRTLRNLWNLTSCFKDGVRMCHLPNEYKIEYGTPIPYYELGYDKLKSFLQDIPDVIRLKKEKTGLEYAVVAVRHIIPKTSSLASQQKEVLSTSNESINCATQNSWETSSNSSSNTSNSIPAADLKTSIDRSLESIQSVMSSCATITSITQAAVTKPKPVLPSFSQAAPNETVSSNELNLSKSGSKPTLNSFLKIEYSIESAEFNSLLLMNMLLYGDDSFVEILKRGILAFDGLPFSEDSDEWKQKQLLLSMLPVDTLKECLKLLCLECDSNNKQVLMYKIMQFLSSPDKMLHERKI